MVGRQCTLGSCGVEGDKSAKYHRVLMGCAHARPGLGLGPGSRTGGAGVPGPGPSALVAMGRRSPEKGTDSEANFITSALFDVYE